MRGIGVVTLYMELTIHIFSSLSFNVPTQKSDIFSLFFHENLQEKLNAFKYSR